MAKVVKKSVAPIYLSAAVWLLGGIFLPFYRPIHYLAAAIISAAVYVIGKAIFPDQVFQTPEPKAPPREEAPPEPKATGDPELDALIRERDLALSRMRASSSGRPHPGAGPGSLRDAPPQRRH